MEDRDAAIGKRTVELEKALEQLVALVHIRAQLELRLLRRWNVFSSLSLLYFHFCVTQESTRVVQTAREVA